MVDLLELIEIFRVVFVQNNILMISKVVLSSVEVRYLSQELNKSELSNMNSVT